MGMFPSLIAVGVLSLAPSGVTPAPVREVHVVRDSIAWTDFGTFDLYHSLEPDDRLPIERTPEMFAVPCDSRVKILGQGLGRSVSWYRIRTRDGRVGYMSQIDVGSSLSR